MTSKVNIMPIYSPNSSYAIRLSMNAAELSLMHRLISEGIKSVRSKSESYDFPDNHMRTELLETLTELETLFKEMHERWGVKE